MLHQYLTMLRKLANNWMFAFIGLGIVAALEQPPAENPIIKAAQFIIATITVLTFGYGLLIHLPIALVTLLFVETRKMIMWTRLHRDHHAWYEWKLRDTCDCSRFRSYFIGG